MKSIQMKHFFRSIFKVLIFIAPMLAQAVEMRGNFEFQSRLFTQDASYPTQSNSDISLAAVPEFFWSWNDDNDSFEMVPSVRLDQRDAKRTHADIREFSWVHVSDEWESRIGVRRVFWGVTEFQHLVDIINQTDAVEDVDNEDKLGQPMLNLSITKDWGITDFFILPYFRERTFAGRNGRPGLPFVNSNDALYESSKKENHMDWAIRWNQSFDEVELSLSWFEGTSRNPDLIQNPLQQNVLELVPYYRQISQLGIEYQQSVGDTLVKLEVIHNKNSLKDYWALQGGLEYTQYGILESNADLGWLVEYAFDDRKKLAPTNFQNDVFIGIRLALNDIDSTEILMGLSYDLDFHSKSFVIESSRRWGDSIKLSLDVRLFTANDVQDPIYLFRKDDHIQFTAQYYY